MVVLDDLIFLLIGMSFVLIPISSWIKSSLPSKLLGINEKSRKLLEEFELENKLIQINLFAVVTFGGAYFWLYEKQVADVFKFLTAGTGLAFVGLAATLIYQYVRLQKLSFLIFNKKQKGVRKNMNLKKLNLDIANFFTETSSPLIGLIIIVAAVLITINGIISNTLTLNNILNYISFAMIFIVLAIDQMYHWKTAISGAKKKPKKKK